jgi:hypothetical protein
MLEIGKVPINGEASETILEEASRSRDAAIIAEAMGRAEAPPPDRPTLGEIRRRSDPA